MKRIFIAFIIIGIILMFGAIVYNIFIVNKTEAVIYFGLICVMFGGIAYLSE